MISHKRIELLMLPHEEKCISLNIFIWMKTEEKLKIICNIFSLNMAKIKEKGIYWNMFSECSNVLDSDALFSHECFYFVAASTTKQVPGHPGIHRKSMSWKKNKSSNSNNWQTFSAKEQKMICLVLQSALIQIN